MEAHHQSQQKLTDMAKPSPDFGEFKYDKQGVCTNPKTLLEHESDTLTYKLLISQCRMGFCIGFLFDQEGTTPVGQSVSIHNTVYRLEEEAIKDLCTQAHEFFKGNMKRIPALEELNKFILSSGLKDLMKGERKGTPIMHVVPAAKKQQPDAGTSTEKVPYAVIFAEIKDDFCNYHYRITTGKHKDFVHRVTNKIGIIDDDLRESFSKLAVHLAVKDDIFKHSGREIQDIEEMHTDELATLYSVTAFKIGGEGSAETVALVGNKYLSDGTRMELETPRIAIDNLSSYKWWDQLNQALATCRTEVSLYHEGKYTLKEKVEPEPDKNQGSLFEGGQQPGEHDHDDLADGKTD